MEIRKNINTEKSLKKSFPPLKKSLKDNSYEVKDIFIPSGESDAGEKITGREIFRKPLKMNLLHNSGEEKMHRLGTAGFVSGSGAVAFAAASPGILAGTVQTDKLLHTSTTCAATFYLGKMFGLPPLLSSATVFLGATLVKEFVNDLYLGKGCFDPRDMLANFAGAAEGYALLKALESDELKAFAKL